MGDTKESMPEQPKTVELPAMTDRALLEDLRAVVKAGFSNVNSTLIDFGERLVRVEIRQKDLEEARILDNVRNSQRVKEPSAHDLETAKALAQEVVAREALAKKVDVIDTKTDDQTKTLAEIKAKPDTAAVVLSELRDLAKTPTVQRIFAAAVPVILIALTVLGAKLQASVSKLEEKPQTVQPAPTVYLPIPVVDGGVK